MSFSHMLHSLEESTIHLFGLGPDGTKTILIKAALADRTASPICAAFFSVLFQRWGNLITDDDTRVLKCLKKEIQGLIEQRNRIMHDPWMSKTICGESGPHPMSLVRLRSHAKGASYTAIDYGPQEVRSVADDAGRLAGVINAIVWYSKADQTGPEISRRFEVREDKVYIKHAATPEV